MSLRERVLSAGRWNSAAAALRLLLQLVQTMVLARLLMPEDFGLMATVGAFVALLLVVSDAGASRALVHFRSTTPRQFASLYWTGLALAIVLSVLFFAVAMPVASMLGDPRLVSVISATGLVFPLATLGLPFRTLAEKDLRFDVLARIELAAAAIGVAVSIASAGAGLGVHALVAGLLAGTAASTALSLHFLARGKWPGAHWNLAEIAPMLRFGAYQMFDRLAATAQLQADLVIGGTVVGPSALGVYSVPRDFNLRIAAAAVNPVLTRIGFPVLAQLQHDRAALKSVYLQMLRLTSAINFPLYAVLALFAEPVTSLLFGPRWAESAWFVRIFALWGLVRSVGAPVGNLLDATGSVRRGAAWNAALLVIVPAALACGALAGGLRGLAWAMLGMQLAIFVPSWWFLVRPCCDATLGEFIAALAPCAAATAAATIAGWLVGRWISGPDWTVFLLALSATGVVYLAASLAWNRDWMRVARDLLRVPAGGGN